MLRTGGAIVQTSAAVAGLPVWIPLPRPLDWASCQDPGGGTVAFSCGVITNLAKCGRSSEHARSV
jgi:hypothetical protein